MFGNNVCVKGSALSYYLYYTLLCFNKVWKKDGHQFNRHIYE